MPNGLGGEPGSQISTGIVAPTPPVTVSLSAQQAAADRVGPGRDDDLRIGHAAEGGTQRPGHAAGTRAGDQEHVGVPRAGGEEYA